VPIPVVLDVDTGVDDACALLLAALHPGVDLRAVTCVAGNAPVADVVRNTRIVLDAAGRPDVPVGRGARRPLLEAPRPARHVHGEDGMGDLGLPEPAGAPPPLDAVDLLRDVLVAAADTGQPVTLVPLAPLTNVALLLRTYPEAARGLARIVFMGGAALVGNATAAAEFNVFHDPEAAAIVLDAAAELGVPVTMYGLDVFYEVRVTRADGERLAASADAAARLAGRLVLFQCDRFGGDDATIGDAGALCAVLDPGGLVTQRWPVRVELTGSWTRGQTVVDRRSWAGDHDHDPHGIAPTVVDVALGVDGPRYAELWLSTMTKAVSERA
jgi:pyrimidine-specific ribonucleoside hydrolase